VKNFHSGSGRLKGYDMPIYEFHCLDCGHDFEDLILGINSPVNCRYCESGKVEKLMSAVSFKTDGKFTSTGSSGCTSCASKSCSSCK